MKAAVKSRPRLHLWFLYFLFILTMSTGLSLISPYYGGLDEATQFIYLYDIFDGDVPMDSDTQAVPAWLKENDYKCWAFDQHQSVHCAGEVDTSHTSPVKAATSAANYPPLYYLLVGWPIKFLAGTTALRTIRFLSSILFAALAALGLSFLRTKTSRYRTDFLALIVITPSAYVLSGSLQPQALEIGAAIALAGILIPLSHAPEETNLRLKWAIPIVFLLTASRTTGMWWAFMIGLLVLLTLQKAQIITLVKNRLFWIFVAASALWCSFALLWTLGTKDWYEFHSNHVSKNTCDILDCIVPGATELHQFEWMTAVSGWLDTCPPAVYIYLYWIAISLIVVFALFINAKKTIAVTLFIDIVYLVSSVALTISWVDIYGESIWQGRYFLPLAIPYLMVIVSIVSQSRKIPPTHYRWLTRISSLILSLLFFFFSLNATLRFWSGIGNGIDIWQGPFHAPWHAQIGLILCLLASFALCIGIWYATRSSRDVSVAGQSPAIQDNQTLPSSIRNAKDSTQNRVDS